MITPPAWFERRFRFGLPAAMFPALLERLRGTPARLEDRLAGAPRERLVRRDGEAWSVQEHAGHLLVLEALWAGRVDDVLAGEERLRPADLSNAATFAADFDSHDLDSLLARFRSARSALVERLEGLGEADIERSALHPRLEQPMRLIDLAEFVAEHDDHHLAQINRLLRG